MKRRDFLASSAAIATIGALGSNLHAEDEGKTPEREYYELRRYHLRMGPKQKLFEEYFRHAAVPALNRAGVSPVGVFNVMIGPDSPTTYVLLPCGTFEGLAAAKEKVWADEEYQKSGAEFLDAAATDPALVRMESWLLRAFAGQPKMEVPAATAAGTPRLFELRTYESPSEKTGRKKVEMFNSGEIDIFKRVGPTPVFFGETLIGAKMPNLTYMVVFADLTERAKKWAAFGSDPEWKRMSGLPEYADIVSNISNSVLQPAGYSQI
jgi:hypothetical protein